MAEVVRHPFPNQKLQMLEVYLEMIKNKILASVAVVLTLTSFHNLCAQESNTQADQEAVKQSIVGYVNAINSKDPKAASSCWSDTGVWIGPDGMEITGRAAIEKHMTELFAAGQMPSIELVDVHVRFIAPNVATEEGHVIVTNPNGTPHKASYISIHVRTPQGWKLDSVRETLIADDIGNHIYLRELDWMIGTWRDESGPYTVETNCEWTANRNFILRTFQVVEGDVTHMEGTQIVGWDGDRKQIRSWVFDSDGGFGTGYWTRNGSSWVVDARFQTADGTQGSSVNQFTLLDKNRFSYTSADRVLGSERQPDVAGVIINRVQNDATSKGAEGGR